MYISTSFSLKNCFFSFKKVSNELRKLTRDLRKDFEKHLVSNVGIKPKAFGNILTQESKLVHLLMNYISLTVQLPLPILKWPNY